MVSCVLGRDQPVEPGDVPLGGLGAVLGEGSGVGVEALTTGSLSGEASAFLARRRNAANRSARGRKAYGITDEGRVQLVALIERLAAARARLRAGRERFDTYTRSLAEHGTEATERDISWLDRLIAAEHARDHAAERQED